MLHHPTHRRRLTLGLMAAGALLIFLAPEAGGLFGAALLAAGFGVEGWAIYREKHGG